MSENLPMDNNCSENCETKPIKIRKKRDVFRFKGNGQDMALNLDYVYKITQTEKRISFIPVGADPDKASADYVEFENEDAAQKAVEQILTAWSSEVVEE